MDEFGDELTFHLLDELARATVRGRIVADEFLAARRVTRIGPLMELVLLDRSGTLPLSALSDCQILHSLSVALLPSNACRGTFATDDAAAFGFITAGRNATTPDRNEELRWVEFRQKAQQAAELSLPKPIAQGLMGAMTEIEENIHLHSERAETGIVAFRGSMTEFEVVVADSGVGVLASLQSSPDYARLDDAGKALHLALQDGTSRLNHIEKNRGFGFRDLFHNLASLNGELRFRSDDQAVTIEGIGPELVGSTLRQKTPMQGFSASIVCRPCSNGGSVR